VNDRAVQAGKERTYDSFVPTDINIEGGGFASTV
jgi:hypothetical protein